MRVSVLIVAVSLILAGGAGFLTSQAVSQSGPTKTVTIDVGKGTQGTTGIPGPPGPKGEKGDQGPAGGLKCPAGYTLIDLIINHPGGHTTILTCEKNL